MKTFPGRIDLAILAVIDFGTMAASSSATFFAYAETTSESWVADIGQHNCMPFLPDVFGYDEMPSSASRSRMRTATPQHSLRLAGAPGSRSTTIRSGSD